MALPRELMYAMAAVTCAGLAAVSDVRERRIPNKLVLASMAVGVVLHAVLEGPRGVGAAALAALIAGAIFMVIHLAGGMGAGDVKLMSALACVSATSDVRMLVAATMLTGAVFALGLATLRGALLRTVRNVLVLVAHHREHGVAPHPELNVRNEKTLRLPYAVPMATAAAIVLVLHLVPGAAR